MASKRKDGRPRYQFFFQSESGEERVVRVYPCINDIKLNGIFWHKIKAVPNEEKKGMFDVFLPIDDKQYRILYADSTEPENIDYSIYKRIIEEAKTKKELLIIKAIYGLAYP